MANIHQLHDVVGVVTQIIDPDAYDSDNLAASDNHTLAVEGYDKVLFLLGVGDVGAGATADVAIVYASTGNISDAAEISTATDAFFAQVDTDGPNEVYLLDLDMMEAGMAGDGVLGATLTITKDVDLGLWAIPYGGTRSRPATQQNTVVEAG